MEASETECFRRDTAVLVLFSKLIWNMVGRKLSSSKICSSRKKKKSLLCISCLCFVFKHVPVCMCVHVDSHTLFNILTLGTVTNSPGRREVNCAFLHFNTSLSSTRRFGPKNVLHRTRDPGSHLSRPIYLVS